MSGSPPAIETIGAPHSSIAPIAWSTGIRRRSSSSGCWILPQPSQARLHWNRGSSSTINGYLSLPRSFCSIRYAPMRAACLIGTGISLTPLSRAPHFRRQLEVHVLGGHTAFAHVNSAQTSQRADDTLNERLGRRRAGRPPDAADAGQRRRRDLLGTLHQERVAPGALGDLDQPA